MKEMESRRMWALDAPEKQEAEQIYELVRRLPPEGRRLMATYGEALRDARELWQQRAEQSA